LGKALWTPGESEARVEIAPRGEESATFREVEDAIWELEGRLRLERVERGWAVYTAGSKRLGYVDQVEPGKYALRDDYSSPPRAFARVDEPAVKSPAGAILVEGTPRTDAVLLLPFAVDGVDNLTRVALGLWLLHAMPGARDTGPTETEDAASD